MEKMENWTYEKISTSHLRLFRFIGILPYITNVEQPNFRINFLNNIASICFHILNTIYNTMHLAYGIRIALEGKLNVDYICEIVVVQGFCFRYLIIYLQRKQLISLVNFCGEIWSQLKTDEGMIVRYFERKAYYLRNFFLWLGAVTLTFYLTTAPLVKLPPTTINGTPRRVLPFKFYVDVQDEFWYYMVFTLQAIVCGSLGILIAGIETVSPFLIMMVSGYLRVIQSRFLAMTNTPNDDGSSKLSANKMEKLPIDEVVRCVKLHQDIMDFCRHLDQFTRHVFIVQVICTIYNMSLIGLKILENDPNKYKYISIFSINLLQFFACQWFPQFLLNESDAVASAAYAAALTHPVYEHKANQMLLLMILRAEKPVQLTAGGFIKLSLETFERMCMSAFSFFTVLRSFSE